MTRLAVTGAGGHMGRAVLAAAAERADCEVGLAVGRPDTGDVAGVAVEDEADLPALLESRDPDVLVDFTAPEASRRYVAACAGAGVAAVVGTTGYGEAERSALQEASESVPVLKATNFSRGIAALRRAVREALAAVPGYDVELTETHHNRKVDAPSGTAKTLLADVRAASAGAAGDDATGDPDVEPTAGSESGDHQPAVHGREGDQPRTTGEVGVHARRAGDVTGEHEVLLAGNHELLSLSHRAESRGVFAAGALDAAAWLVDREPGRYEFTEVLE